uniref:Uncharacterized protein n=1 Tax=Ditylenchus dipsaci TaxID=166011 RepID=A0A915EB85_9BILA
MRFCPPFLFLDLASTDFHLFRGLQNLLSDETFEYDDELEEFIQNWINNIEPIFFHRGIMKLSDRWREGTNNGVSMLPKCYSFVSDDSARDRELVLALVSDPVRQLIIEYSMQHVSTTTFNAPALNALADFL